jgi:soluble cytochrome b562
MDVMKGAFRNIRSALQAPADADKEKYTGFADTLISAAGKAKEFEPEKTAKIPEAERAQFLADYRQSMDALIVLFEQLKSQLAAGDWEAARAQMRLIGEAQADGHEKFRPEEF